MVTVAVQLVQLHKRFQDVQAVDGLDLEIHKGEIFGLLGPNGAGKTTTIKMLLGLIKPMGGRVEVLGFNPARQAREVRARTGYVMQQTAADLYLTGRENLQIFAELFNVPAGNLGQRVDEVLEWAGLTEAANRLVLAYSGGMKRRLNLGISLLHRPELFLLDEPTLGLDVRARRQVWQLIREIKAAGTTIVLTTHYLEEANQLCDRVGIMDKGKLVGLGTPNRLKKDLVDDLHRLTIRLESGSELDGLELPVPAQVQGTEYLFSGPHSRLWRVLAIFQEHFGDEIREVTFSQPSLDDVVLKLTRSQSETQAGGGDLRREGE